MTYYFKSTYTGQVYKMDFYPQFAGYEPSNEEEYNVWVNEHLNKPLPRV